MRTPDSSRFWPADEYEPGHGQPSFDKQFARDWLKANPDNNWVLPQDVVDKTIHKYLQAYEMLMMSFIQKETPQDLIGKVIAVILTVSMCAQPLGNAMYGILFEVCEGTEYIPVFLSGAVSLAIALGAGKVFRETR